MPLSADIALRLDASTLVGTLLGGLSGSAAALGAIAVPDTGENSDSITSAVASFDAASLSPAIARLVEQGGASLSAIVPPTNLLGGIGGALTLVEQATSGNLRADIETLLARLTQELEGSREGGAFGVLMRLAQMLGAAPQGKLVATLLQSLLGAGGVTPPPALRELGSLLPALDSLVRAVGGLMMLESVLSEAQRLTGVMARQLDAAAARRGVDQLLALLTTALAARIAGTDAADDAALDALAAALGVAADRLGQFEQELAAGMGLGEATLAYLDVAQVQAEAAGAAALLRNIDLGPLERQLRKALGGLAPFLAFDFSTAPAQSLASLLGQAEAQVADIAAQIGAWDPAELVAPLQQGMDALSAPLAELSRLIEQAMVGIRAGLDAIKRVVVELPLGDLAAAIDTLVEPITRALALITALVADVAAALAAAADAAVAALDEVEGLVDGFKAEVRALFAQARQFVDDLNLEAIVGGVAERIGEFTQALAQAQLKPYFDTAVGAIDTATGVIEEVPFALLPESMKADVDAAVAPIKAVDVEAFATQIEAMVGIGADGSFRPRADLDAAIAQIQAKFDALIATLREHDPEQYLARLDAKLAELAAKIGEVAPAVSLQPVQQAIDQVKAAIVGFDLAAQLAPLQQVFDDAIAAMQPYSPGQLVEPLQQRIAAARQKVVDSVRFAAWSPTLDAVHERAAQVLALIDPAQLEGKLVELLSRSRELTADLPDLNPQWLGSIVAALHRGAPARIHPLSYPVVQGWIDQGNGAAALTARSAAIADAVARTHAAVAAIDVSALAGELLARTQPVRAALIELLAGTAADSRHRAPLLALAVRLDVQGGFSQLAANRQRYLALLATALPLGETLRRTGLSEVDSTIDKLHRGFEPVRAVLGSVRAFVRAAGLPEVDAGVPRMLRALFEAAPPARLAGLSAPIFVALRERVLALIDAVILPLKAGIGRLEALIAALDLAPLQAALDAVFQDVLAEVRSLSPTTLLAAPIAAVAALKTEVAAFDPLQALLGVLDALRDTVARVLAKLSAQALLADPAAIYREIVDALDALNVRALMAPVLDLLDSIAHDVDAGLDQTVAAFERLQDALPAGGGGSSVSVEVTV